MGCRCWTTEQDRNKFAELKYNFQNLHPFDISVSCSASLWGKKETAVSLSSPSLFLTLYFWTIFYSILSLVICTVQHLHTFWKSSPKFSFALTCWNTVTLGRSAEMQAGKVLGFSRPYASVCFNWNSSFLRNDSSGPWKKQLGKYGTYPGQDKAPKPDRSACSHSPKAGFKLKPYE